MPLVVRAFTTRARPGRRRQRRRAARSPRQRRRRYPHEALVTDTECRGENHKLDAGGWQLLRDPPNGEPGTTCIEEGLYYADDLPERDATGFAALRRFAETYPAAVAPGYPPRLVLMSKSEWLERRLYRYGYRHRNRCEVVGFRLSYDLGAVATHYGEGRGRFRGGWSLGLWGAYDEAGQWHDRRYHPRLLMRALDGRRTVYAWGSLDPVDDDDLGVGGRFVDLQTTALALTGEHHSLETACAAFGEPYTKREVEYGTVSEELCRYLLEDVRATASLYRRVWAECRRHEGIDLQPHRLYSPAGIATAYYEAMGLARPLEKFTDLASWELGWPEGRESAPPPTPVSRRTLGRAMSAFFGARAEGRLVRELVPVVVVDCVSEYPSVDAILGTWRMLIAARLEEADATEAVRALLAQERLEEQCLRRSFWSEHIGCTLVEIDQPCDATLPARSHWNPLSADPGIGVNPLTYRGRLWYMLPDVIAASLHGAEVTVARAIRLVPVGVQPGLQPVRFRGDFVIDPLSDDPFVALVEERQGVLRDSTLPAEERRWRAQSAKVAVNSASFGVLGRFDRHDLAHAPELVVHGPDDEPLRAFSSHPEDPGPYCWPPAAANATAGGRLLLALFERRVAARGGTYAYTDTDAMSVLATPHGGQLEAGGEIHQLLSWTQVEEVIAEFDRLNPYDPALVPHLWKVEHDSMTEPLYAYVVATKRYALARLTDDDEPRLAWVSDSEDDEEESLTDWSEHGLGAYLDPSTGDDGRSPRDALRRRLWIRDGWKWVLGRELGTEVRDPPWLDRYALSQFSLARPRQLEWFAGRDARLPPQERMRPGSFGLLAQLHGFLSGLGPRAHPAAPYERAAGHWAELDWYDRTTGERIRLTTADPAAEPDHFVAEHERGAVRVKTLRDALSVYARRPEYKSLPPDGSLPHGRARGLLRRRPIESTPALTTLAGKEGNRLFERATGELADDGTAAYRLDLGGRMDWWEALLLPVAQALGSKQVAAALGLHRRTVERALSGRVRPSDRRLHAWAVGLAALAREELTRQRQPLPKDDVASLQAYLDALPRDPRRCACGCGSLLAGSRRRWATEACRKRAARRRWPRPYA